MKPKPDIGEFKRPFGDPEKFLEGGAADAAQRTRASGRGAPVPATPPEPTVQKLFRLPWNVANALKLKAAQESVAAGRRVTETELVEGMLREHLGC